MQILPFGNGVSPSRHWHRVQRSVSGSSPQQSFPSKSHPAWLFWSSQIPSPFQSRLKHPKKSQSIILQSYITKADTSFLIHIWYNGSEDVILDSQFLHIHRSLTFVRVIRIVSIAETLGWIIFILETAIPRVVQVIYVCSRAEAMVWVPLICNTTSARIASVINRCTVAEALSYIQVKVFSNLLSSPISANFKKLSIY